MNNCQYTSVIVMLGTEQWQTFDWPGIILLPGKKCTIINFVSIQKVDNRSTI